MYVDFGEQAISYMHTSIFENKGLMKEVYIAIFENKGLMMGIFLSPYLHI